MPLSDLKLKKIYRTKQDNVTDDFLIPALKESYTYDRGSGFFTLDSLANIADGLIPFIQHGGVVRVVTSVQLSDADVAIINNGLQLQQTTVIDKIHQKIEEDIENEDTLMKLDFITNLIAAGILTIKIAYLPDGIYHEKIGVMTDKDGGKLYFSGSNNATVSGLNKNWETIMLLTSWWGDEEEIKEQQAYFDHLWANDLEGLEVMPFPEAEQKNLIRKYKVSSDVRTAIQRLQNKSKKRTKKKDLYDYQKIAVRQFLDNDGNHFYEMATGTGKTFTAIKSIIALHEQNTWTEEMIAELNSLIRKLPPDNINSAMGEKVHQLRVASGDKRKAVKNDFDSLNESNEKIKQLKDRIASLSTQITKSGSEAAEEIENRYQKLQDEIIRLSANLQNIDSRLPGMDKDLEAKKKLKATLSQGEADTITIEKESAFVEKCLIALEKIKGANRITALKQINKRLQEAYKMLSDDYDLGRRIYIVQYDQVSMFQIITYFENQYQDTLSNMQKKGTVASLKAMGQSDEEIQETAILSCAQPNSTGQSKMNTLAFVKAILDFANEPQSGGIFEMTKAYPLLIDAPFGDIFDKNLEKSAMSLHAFTHQIILMLAKDSYRDVEDYVGPFVSTVHLFEKEPNEDHSNIIVSSMEEI